MVMVMTCDDYYDYYSLVFEINILFFDLTD